MFLTQTEEKGTRTSHNSLQSEAEPFLNEEWRIQMIKISLLLKIYDVDEIIGYLCASLW